MEYEEIERPITKIAKLVHYLYLQSLLNITKFCLSFHSAKCMHFDKILKRKRFFSFAFYFSFFK